MAGVEEDLTAVLLRSTAFCKKKDLFQNPRPEIPLLDLLPATLPKNPQSTPSHPSKSKVQKIRPWPNRFQVQDLCFIGLNEMQFGQGIREPMKSLEKKIWGLNLRG